MKAEPLVGTGPMVDGARWPEPLSAAEWDRRFPGLLDGAGIVVGAVANVIMQLSHPAVGHGVVESRVESGKLFRHPVKRIRTTLTYLAVALVGTREEKLAYRSAITKVHALVRSDERSPVKYSGLDPELQLWVGACLYWGYVDAWIRLRGRPSEETLDAVYKEMAPLATTLQVRPEMWPENRQAFEQYWQKSLREIHIDDEVRNYLTALVDLKFASQLTRLCLAPLTRLIASGVLPPEVREQMRFTWTPAREWTFDFLLGLGSLLNRILPRVIRQAHVYGVMAAFRFRLRRSMPLL